MCFQYSNNFFKIPSLFFCLCIIVSQLTACSKPTSDFAEYSSAEPVAESSMPSEKAISYDTSQTADQANTADSSMALSSKVTQQENLNPALERKQLVISTQAHFQVNDVLKTASQIELLAIQQGGYVANTHIENLENKHDSYPIGNHQQKTLISYIRQAHMVLRVPKNQVEAFLTQLQTHITFLNSSQFSAKDTTLEIQKAEVEAQIQALKEQALREQNLRNRNESTQMGNVSVITETALAKQQQLYAELQQKALLDQVQLSTIELTFRQPEKIREEISEDIEGIVQDEQSINFVPRLLDGLKAGGRYFIEFILWLSQFWAFIFAVPLLIWLFKLSRAKWQNYRQNKKKS